MDTTHHFNIEDLQKIDEETACVIVEPIKAEVGVQLPEPGYLEQLRAQCTKVGALLVFDEIQVGQVSLSLRLDPSQFYDEEGSGDYTLVFEFTNDFGSDTSSFDGRTYWAWFHVCETGSDGKCQGDA